MTALVNGGFVRDQIVVAIPAHGRSYILSDVNNIVIGDKINGEAPASSMTNKTGLLAFYEVGVEC